VNAVSNTQRAEVARIVESAWQRDHSRQQAAAEEIQRGAR
jgi:hypothetical protein